MPTEASITHQTLQRRIAAAKGELDCDLILADVQYLDVFTCQFRKGDVAMIDGVIVGLDRGLRARRVVQCTGKTVVPGFVDAHVHVESSMMLPAAFQTAVLPLGTTTAICDPHEIANVVGPRGLHFFLNAAAALSMNMRIMLSSCVPATHLETNGGGHIDAATLTELARHERALGLAEMMNVPGVLNADPAVLDKLQAFSSMPVDGHCPLLSGLNLSAYAAAGITTCHESSELREAEEKLTKGIAVWIREGSVAKDLETLLPLLTAATSTTMGFCTDDRNPKDIAEEGHIDDLVRRAIARGVSAEVALRAASYSVARHYGLAQGPERLGAVAPGYRADLIVLDDVNTVAINKVLKNGNFVDTLEAADTPADDLLGTVRAHPPELADLKGPTGSVHVIGVIENKIITEHHVMPHDAAGVRPLCVLERYGGHSKPANGYVLGFGELRGAIAASVGHDSHNLIAVGDTPQNQRAALAALIDCGGGFCVVHNGSVVAKLPLPYGGLMSKATPAALRQGLHQLHEASRAINCVLGEPFLQLAFLSLPVIPRLKLTNKGLVDVERFEIISVRAA